ncbi:MAG: hypothetical protein V3U71_10770 [Cocleimonas sp.]
MSSLFTAVNKRNKATIISLDIKEMKEGEIRKTLWDGKQVAVLYRSQHIVNQIRTQNNVKETGVEMLNPISRSILPEYFVFINRGDSGNCPLFYRANTLKDICSGKTYNTMGNLVGMKNKNKTSYQIEVPPHTFFDLQIRFGQWK